jgi:antitoxin FitA
MFSSKCKLVCYSPFLSRVTITNTFLSGGKQMATLHPLNIPDELYERLQELAKAENSSVDAQVITILQKALETKTKEIEDERRKNILKVLDESSSRHRLNPADFGLPDSTEMIREDRDR